MRIRSIKPEFWRSDDVNAMCIEDRLLFIGLWSYVDDNGVGIDRVANITADLFAHDLSVSPHGALMRTQDGLNRLAQLGVIHRYEVSGKPYLEIANWSKHQKINRPSPGRYPKSDHENALPHASLTEDSLNTHESSVSPHAPEQGNRGTEEQGIPPTAGRDDAPHPEPEPEPIEGEVVQPNSAQTLVAEWIDNSLTRPPNAVIGQVARQVKSLLAEGQPYDHVRNGLALWARKKLHPSTLPSVVYEAQQPRPARTTKADHQRAILAQFMERETA